ESVSGGQLLNENQIQKNEAPSRAQRFLEKRDILFQMVRPYQKNNYFFDKEGDYVASTGYAQLRTEQNPHFVFQYLHYQGFVDKVIKRCTGTSYPAINSADLSKIGINLPKYSEQKKIADFLALIDERIQTQIKIINHLQSLIKGFCQKLFLQELRFKSKERKFFPEWQYKKGNFVFENVSDKNHNSDIPILAITQDKGAVPRDMIDYSINVTENSVSNYKVVKKGDFIISLRSFQGGIEYSKYTGICSPA